MASFTICNLPDETHRALRVRATMHGLSTEADTARFLKMLFALLTALSSARYLPK